MDDKKILSSLVNESLISEELATSITDESIKYGKSAEDILFEKNIIDEVTLTKAKSKILGIPYKKIDIDKIPDDVFKIIPQETAEAYRVIAIELKDKTLVIGMITPWDVQAQDALRFIAKQNDYNLGVYLVTPSDIERAIRRYSPYKTEIERALDSLRTKGNKGSSDILKLIELDKDIDISDDAPIIKIVSASLKEAVARGASDIHVEPEKTRMRIRLRIDGILQEVSSFPSEVQKAIVSRIKILASLKIDETRIPQDGRFRTKVFRRDIDFRVATFPTPLGEKVVLRVLDPTVGLKNINELGLIGKTENLANSALKEPFGMILITGPTGSGKTTTLYSLLQTLDRKTKNVVSLEDPVEYFVEGISQSQVKPEIGYTFASGLRQILRQDPDVIMVGEIRDDETADLAVHAALTGHIVLATLHTNNAIGVVPRLIDMGVEPFLLPASLSLMISQRLVRRLCDKCKEEIVAPGKIQEIIKAGIDSLSPDIKSTIKYKVPYKIYKAKGCSACGSRGTVGRIAVFEGFAMTRELEAVINSGHKEGDIRSESVRQGMITLRQDGILKALDGLISMEEVIRET